jgi:UDP-glucose 4-epimerase
MEASASTTTRHRIALTGATGGLGRAILAELAARSDCSALVLVRDAARLVVTVPRVQVEPVDFSDESRLARLLESYQPTVLIHAAATGMQIPRPPWREMLECNVALSVRLCELAARLPRCRFVFVSSGLAYRDQGRALREDDPVETNHPYAASKAAAETLVRAVAAEDNLPLTIIRPFSFSGPGDAGSRLFPSLLRAAERGQSLELSSGEQVRSHCAVQDVARGVLAAATKGDDAAAVACFNLGSDRTESLRHLVEGVVAELGLQVQLKFGARPATPFEPRFLAADISRAQAQLGWRPQVNFAHAVWALAQESFPGLRLREPRQNL